MLSLVDESSSSPGHLLPWVNPGRGSGWTLVNFDGLVQERRNSSALAMELCLSCAKPSTCHTTIWVEM